MKKIAYISSPCFADCDIPLLHNLQKISDITYILKISDKTKKQTLININKIKRRGGLYPASDFKELNNLAKYIDLSKVYVLNMPGKHDLSIGNLLSMFRLLLFLIRHKFNIIHLTWPLRYGEFFIYLLRRRIVLTMHDPLPHSSEDTKLNKFHRKICFMLINNYILLNQSQKEDFITKYKLQRKNIYISKLSIYTHLQDTKPIFPNISGYLLFVGKINTHKGIDYLCEAMEHVQNKFKDKKLIIAGSGKIYFDIRQYTDKGYVEFINRYLSDEELAGLIRSADIVICPYIDATQSGVLMSAFALDTPVIATNVGGLPEMVVDGKYGVLIPPKSSAALTDAIVYLLSNRDVLEDMKKNIHYDYSLGENSWKIIAERIVKAYDNII